MIKGAVLVSPKFFISFILIIIIICIILVIVQPGADTRKSDNSPELDKNYFKRPPDWGTTSGKSVTVKNSKGEVSPLSGTSICSLYTYENDFDIDIKPSLVNIFQDYYDGLVHQNTNIDNLTCLDPNQILAQNGIHTCESKIPNSCINAYGNYVNYGVSETYTVNCRNGLPPCPGTIYSISCNFQLNFVKSLDINSKFLSINIVEVNDKDYDKLNKEKKYYVDQGFFSKNNSLADGTYKPIFFNDMYKSSSARQQFKFIRYTYNSDKKVWEINELGPFAAIIFQPANAYLTADKNFDFILKTLDNIDYLSDPSPIVQWLMVPSMNLQPGPIASTIKFARGNIKNLSSAATIYGSSAGIVNNSVTYFDPSAVFLPYNDVKINDMIAPLPSTTTGVLFSLDGDGNTNITNPWTPSSYPKRVYKAVQGGEASDQADFYQIGLSAQYKYTTWIDGTDPDFNKPIQTNPTAREEFISLDQVSSTALKKHTTITTGWSEGQNGGPQPSTQPVVADQMIIWATLKPNKPISNDFSYGNLIFDNQAIWESINPYDTVIAFDPNYFVQSRSISIAHTIDLNSSGSIKYEAKKTGLVNKITADKINYSFTEFTAGSKQVLLNSDNTSLKIDPDPNNNAVIDLVFESSQDTNGNPVVALADILVTDPGSGYTNTSFDINAVALGASAGTQPVTNLNLVTREQTIIYTAVSLSLKGTTPEPFNPVNSRINDFKNGGMIIPEDDVTIDNGKFTLKSNITLGASFGGEGYNVGDIIYINQLDQFGNSLLGPDFDPIGISANAMKQLANVEINSLQSAPNDKDSPAPYSLLRSVTVSGNTVATKNDIIYNFWSDSKAQYSPSPPQIAFVGQGLIDQLKDVIKEGSAEEISSFFASSKKDDSSFYTSIENIRTIQFTELNYSGSYKTTFFSDINNNNNLSTNAQPVLGRFIPYGWFRPPVFELVAGGWSKFPTKLSDYYFYNNNYTQLVPYGLKNIYNRYIDPQNLASV
jgi:hypothetical protein